MAYFAEIDDNNIVVRVIVVDDSQEHRGAEFCSKDLGLGGTWIQTSENGKIRKNFAGIEFTYDKERDAFIAPEPKGNLGFDEKNCQWIMPIEEKKK